MNVVVTGATGFVGTPLVRALLAAGHTVTALTRDVQRAVRRLPARCTVQSWNPEQALDPSALRGADAIWKHLEARAVAVVVRAEHLCLRMRCAAKRGADMVTTAFRGEFERNQGLRAEVLGLLRPPGGLC